MLLVINLVGFGMGLFLVGWLSDWFELIYGVDLLCYVMLVVVLVMLWVIFYYWCVGVLLKWVE